LHGDQGVEDVELTMKRMKRKEHDQPSNLT